MHWKRCARSTRYSEDRFRPPSPLVRGSERKRRDSNPRTLAGLPLSRSAHRSLRPSASVRRQPRTAAIRKRTSARTWANAGGLRPDMRPARRTGRPWRPVRAVNGRHAHHDLPGPGPVASEAAGQCLPENSALSGGVRRYRCRPRLHRLSCRTSVNLPNSMASHLVHWMARHEATVLYLPARWRSAA
jgi:hypothetical protein